MVRMGDKGMISAEKSPEFTDTASYHSTPSHSESLLKGDGMHNENKRSHAEGALQSFWSRINDTISSHGCMQPNKASRPPFR